MCTYRVAYGLRLHPDLVHSDFCSYLRAASIPGIRRRRLILFGVEPQAPGHLRWLPKHLAPVV